MSCIYTNFEKDSCRNHKLQLAVNNSWTSEGRQPPEDLNNTVFDPGTVDVAYSVIVTYIVDKMVKNSPWSAASSRHFSPDWLDLPGILTLISVNSQFSSREPSTIGFSLAASASENNFCTWLFSF